MIPRALPPPPAAPPPAAQGWPRVCPPPLIGRWARQSGLIGHNPRAGREYPQKPVAACEGLMGAVVKHRDVNRYLFVKVTKY